ncbi:3-oxoacyl-[acyl-carrier-protein] reductase FabG [Neomoorella glycerini]|uniref:3-oxoacyl-[acyl-carrier-protein] reductase FabG n=1 Tax=Neomoorella glycerini TaxID=55779 RepID=A0A6I5ZSF5_9FIRM|nr:3-oxoacyl-ACP reductase family protein [Moorella glycerini]QGP92780.1 3-oxoacyl-[acyl-carrier-protein] reductase FabG [Moorella glycerini]
MLAGRVAIITGSGRGIGREMAARFVNRGAKVVVADLYNAPETAREIGDAGQAIGITVDVSKVKSIQEMVEITLKTYGRIDILVNNAGICPTTPLDKITEEEWDQVLAVNLKSCFFCSQAVAEIMKGQQYGRIINISSFAGRAGGIAPGCHYSASKAGIIGLTKALARLLAPYNITVNAIAPGTMVSEMTRAFSEEKMEEILAAIPLGKLGQPWHVAEMAVYLASDAAEWITGATIDINGGMYMA